jgi:hypothetical protein
MFAPQIEITSYNRRVQDGFGSCKLDLRLDLKDERSWIWECEWEVDLGRGWKVGPTGVWKLGLRRKSGARFGAKMTVGFEG